MKRDNLWYDLSQMFIKHQNVRGVRMALQTEVRNYVDSRLKQERLRTFEEVRLERLNLGTKERGVSTCPFCGGIPTAHFCEGAKGYNQAVDDLEALIAKLEEA